LLELEQAAAPARVHTAVRRREGDQVELDVALLAFHAHDQRPYSSARLKHQRLLLRLKPLRKRDAQEGRHLIAKHGLVRIVDIHNCNTA
jgi:hypothetical protein